MSVGKRLRGVLSNFVVETSIAGVSNAGRARSRGRSAVWLLVFSCLAALTATGIYDIVEEYFRYPVITSTDLTNRPEV